MPRGMSISNVTEEYNNLFQEYELLQKENKVLKAKVINNKYNTNRHIKSWSYGFLSGASSILIGTYIGIIISDLI